MIVNDYTLKATPFLLRFSESIPPQQPIRLKYDPVRQVSLIEEGDNWMDATSGVVLQGQTRITKVQAETTDDN